MKTRRINWTVRELVNKIDKIEFPEFQREPTVWKLDKKQRLIDSILRDFDVSSIYFSAKEKEGFDCIDGRQRINAILSYLGINGSDEEHNAFNLKITNEIYDDKSEFKDVEDKRFEKLGIKWKNKIMNYPLNIVEIIEVENDEELNLLFLRLQIASVLNAGEKLHAMTGEMRDFIFLDINHHPFFNALSIPKRRYSKEQVAAQIVLNTFNKTLKGEFHRSRYLDLQDFFKQYTKLTTDDKKILKNVKNTLDKINKYWSSTLNIIDNRAIAVSVYLFILFLLKQGKEREIQKFKEFFIVFFRTLKWQIPKRIEMDQPYHELFIFQTNVTQAAGEKYAIQNRQDFLENYFYFYKKEKKIKGDKEYEKKTGINPDKERNKIDL